MQPSRLSTRLPVAGILAAAAAVLGWLFFGFAGDPAGGSFLLAKPPSGETAVATAQRPSCGLWSDFGGTQSFAEVATLPSDKWRQPAGHGLLVLHEDEVVWLKLTLRNATAQRANGIFSTGTYFMDHADCWIGEDGGGWRHERAGEKIVGGEKNILGRDAAFALDVPAHSEREVYLRFANASRMFTQPEWWPEAAGYHRAELRGLLAEAIYFGGLLALLGYNLVLWVRLRFADIGWYGLYLSTVLAFIFLARGFLSVLGWPLGTPGVETLTVLVTAGSSIFLIQFARIFLESASRLPQTDRVVRGLQWAMIAVVMGGLTVPWAGYIFWMRCAATGAAVTHLLLAGLAVAAWRQGAQQARFFLLAFTCLLLGTLGLTSTWLLAAVTSETGMKLLMLGSGLEMLLLSLAVSDRFSHVQRRLVEETEQRRAIQEAYADELAVEVRERTSELEAANEDKDRMLIALGHDLRSPLSALTKRAEQLRQREASPTALEALQGFAGEAAAEGRQMLLLIEDIVLWARLRTGARPAPAQFAAVSLVNTVVTLHQPLAARRGVVLAANVPRNLMIQTDLVLAQTMVRNLVGNAVKFARSRVDVTVDATTDIVRIIVRDDGPGLPAPVLARLRGEAGGESGGMGLRLTQEIGAVLGATLVAVVPVGGGTEMTMTLPAGGRA